MKKFEASRDCLTSLVADFKQLNGISLWVSIIQPLVHNYYLNGTSVQLFAYSQSFIFEMQVSSTPLAKFVSLSSLNDNKMTDIKLLFASKYHIYLSYSCKLYIVLKFSILWKI